MSKSSYHRILTVLLLIIPILYLLTLARTPVLGDPSEYTTVAHVMGVAHPPGYAFITVVGKLFQTVVPVGTIAWRMHLMSAFFGSLATVFVYGSIRTVGKGAAPHLLAGAAALFAALTIGTAADHWQHSIHANPHIITATFTAANLFFLTRWWADQQLDSGRNRWLYVFSLSTGLGVTQHPLTVFGFPAYGLFVLGVWVRKERRVNRRGAESAENVLERDTKSSASSSRPQVDALQFLNELQKLPANFIGVFRREWRTFLKMLLLALLGLGVWLYFPLRSPNAPLGATGLGTVDGFLTHILARGLTENLPFYSLGDQPQRLVVFWSILRLQYGLVVIFLALFGLLFSLFSRRSPLPRLPVVLYTLTFLSFYAFVISLRVQDIMAYLLGPLLLIAFFAGLGLWQVLVLLHSRLQLERSALLLLTAAVFLLGPVLQAIRNLPQISLRDYDEGQTHVAAVFDWFDGSGAGATLLNDWEHMTPLWYAQFVDGRSLAEADATVTWIGAGPANPWVDAVFRYLPQGPLFLSNYRREIVDAGFRLRARGPFYEVVEPGNSSLPPELVSVEAAGNEIVVVGYGLAETAVAAGDYLPLTLAMTAPVTPTDFYVPVIYVGPVTYTFTTDSHLLTPQWRPGEVIVERFDVALPHDLPAGSYPVTVDLKNLSQDKVIPLRLALGELEVTAVNHPVRTNDLLANFRQRVGLVAATARRESDRRRAPWQDAIRARPGDSIDLTLTWRSLDYAEESYTIFVHLIDLGNRPLVALDYTPLGGSTPTHLWFPKWLPGQQMRDPYRLQIPPDLPPGQYLIEVGLYEMVGKRRLHMADTNGSLVGDRYILGSVIVGE